MVPILTIAACIYILSGLAVVTWVIFGTWIAIVLLYYWFYGRRHAVLNDYTSPEQIAEPIHPEDES
ncbi:hypothetical protein D3C85_1943990 [compost metagenome]